MAALRGWRVKGCGAYFAWVEHPFDLAAPDLARRLVRDAGVLDGKEPGQAVGRPSKEQAEIARLRRELELAQRRLARTEAALDIMGKARALLEELSESADTQAPRT